MSEILDVIKSITSNRESGRLEISSTGIHGVLLFNDGKLVDARLESLSGFQAVNAAASLRDVQFNFDNVVPASHSSTITQSERVVLKRFFGIETAEMEEPSANSEPDPEWNAAPEQVVPLAEVEEMPQTDLEETPTVEVAAIRTGSFVGARQFALLSRSRVAVSLALLLALVIGAIALRSRMKAPQQTATVAAAAESESSSVPDTKPEVKEVASESSSVAVSRHPKTPVTSESPSVAVSREPKTPVRSEAPSVVVSATRGETNERDAKVQDLSGEWQVINTVQKTAYRSFDKLQVGFRLKIAQNGKEFTAKGEKFSENGQTLPAVSRTPILVRGSIDGDKVVATFVEDGRLRRTNGRFVWKLQSDGLAGTFVSTAAKSRGKSAVTKL